MAKDLVIVESPAKARTVGRFLGREYEAMASMGHVRDLPKREIGVAVDNGFKPKYSVLPDKRKVVAEVKKASAAADTVYLATDPDREGEAIAWHLMEAAKIAKSKVRRVVFHEITAPAVRDAFDHPRTIDERLIDAQQARRVLDRLVGYDLSPVLWKKVRRGLSAGRVQSVALRLIVDREHEIAAFVSEEYWTIEALLAKADGGGDAVAFKAGLRAVKGKKGRVSIPNGDEAARITSDLGPAGFGVAKVATKERRNRPAPPFITSSLQQEAFRKLRFTTRRTMAVAQQLYEGVDIGGEGIGRAHHLHAHRLDERGDERRARDEGLHTGEVRPGLRAGAAALLHEESEGRAGGPRGHPPHVRAARPGLPAPPPDVRAAPPVRPDMAPDAREPDGRRAAGRHDRGHRGRRHAFG